MNLLAKATNKMFGYNAVADSKGKRQAPQTRTKHEFNILNQKSRAKLNATAQEQARNHALCAWMIRKHLDYVSKFRVSIRTDQTELDIMLNAILKWHGRPENFDIAKRLGREESFRLYENEKVVNGDAGFIKLKGLKLQGLESDLIAKGAVDSKASKATKKKLEKVNGSGLVVSQSTGERLSFAVCNRGERGDKIIFDHLEPAGNVIFDGYWSRLTSQYRGISPLTTALNGIQDVSMACEYNLVKAKMHALFGVAIMRDAVEGVDGDTAEEVEAGATVEMNPTGFMMTDLNPGEKIETIESKTPSADFVNGTYLFIQLAMLALDIPVTCFDSRRSNFSARIADLNEYEVSTEAKRTKNRYVRQAYSDWLIEQVWSGGYQWELERVATDAGFTLQMLKDAIEWIPAGSPWLDKHKQLTGDALAIDRGADNIIDVCRKRNTNFFDNIDKQEKAEKYAKEHGISLVKGGSGQRSIEEIIAAEARAEADAVIAENEENQETEVTE